jgi:TusA-related sulfurtransferase
MKFEIQDLRHLRCPLVLLTVKRDVSRLSAGESSAFMISDSASIHDIERYLSLHSYQLVCESYSDYFLLKVMKGLS